MVDIAPGTQEFTPKLPPVEGQAPASAIRSEAVILPTVPAAESPREGQQETFGLQSRSNVSKVSQEGRNITPPEPRPVTDMTPQTPAEHWWDKLRKGKRIQ